MNENTKTETPKCLRCKKNPQMTWRTICLKCYSELAKERRLQKLKANKVVCYYCDKPILKLNVTKIFCFDCYKRAKKLFIKYIENILCREDGRKPKKKIDNPAPIV